MNMTFNLYMKEKYPEQHATRCADDNDDVPEWLDELCG